MAYAEPYQILAKQTGYDIIFDQDPTLQTAPLSGATISCVIKNTSTYALTGGNCTIDPVSGYPMYTTLSTDFPTKGLYIVQLNYTLGGSVLNGPVLNFNCLPNVK